MRDANNQNKKQSSGGWWQIAVVAIFGAAIMYVVTEPKPGELEKWVGVKAPELQVTTIDGEELSLSALRGKRVMLDFWATWCPPCLQEVPDLKALQDTLPDEDYALVGISNEDAETVRAFAERAKINYPLVSAARLPEPYRYIDLLPTKLIIDRNGVIQHVAAGLHSKDELEALFTGEDYQGAARPSPYHEGSASH